MQALMKEGMNEQRHQLNVFVNLISVTAVPTTEATCNLTLFKSFQWPKTPVGTFAKVPCPASVVGVSLKPGEIVNF